MNKEVNPDLIWKKLRKQILLLGYTKKEIKNFKVLGGNRPPAVKLNKIFIKKIVPQENSCICGKEGIVENYYVGLNRNRFIVLGSKCYKHFPYKADFRKDFRDIKGGAE